MKIAIITDTHFGARGDNLSLLNHMSKFYDEHFFPELQKRGIRKIIHGGDLVDRRKFVNFQTATRMKQVFLDRLNGYDVYMIAGNHDTFFKDTNNVNALSVLLGGHNLQWYTGPREILLDETLILLLPWICADNRVESLRAIQDTRASIVLGHLEFNGFEMHRGAFCDHGFDVKEFERFELVMSGHFHHKSQRGNIHYLGAPYEMTWSDYNDPRGFHIFDTETRELEFIRNPLRLFHRVPYNDKNTTLEEILKLDFTIFRDTYVKVVVKNKTNPYWFDQYIERLEKAGPIMVQVVDDNFNLNFESDEEIIDGAMDTIDILQSYVDSLGPQLVKKHKLDLALRNLYNEALNTQI